MVNSEIIENILEHDDEIVLKVYHFIKKYYLFFAGLFIGLLVAFFV